LDNPLNFEYEVLKHYYHKGIFARSGIITHLITHLRENANKKNRTTKFQQIGLNDDEILAVLQISIISHIMMFLEDLAVICQSIKDGKIEYYDFLDKSGDEDLGKFISKFYNDIVKASDQDILKILSFTNLDSLDFLEENEKKVIENITKRMLEKIREFFIKIFIFRDNHIKIFRRYKHAGFPIMLNESVPSIEEIYKDFDFVSYGLTSKGNIGKEITVIPYSSKAIDSYENLEKDIFAFFGSVLTFKFICYERNVDGLMPITKSLFGVKLSQEETTTLDEVWKRFEERNPYDDSKRERIDFKTMTEFLHWYTQLDNTSKRMFDSE